CSRAHRARELRHDARAWGFARHWDAGGRRAACSGPSAGDVHRRDRRAGGRRHRELVSRQQALAVAAVLGAVAPAVGWLRTTSSPRHTGSPCGAGFVRTRARCFPDTSAGCPQPLVATDHGCDEAEHDVVQVPETTVTLGPSDWEAEGRVAPRTFVVRPFALDRLEVTVGRACASPVFAGEVLCGVSARAQGGAARAGVG